MDWSRLLIRFAVSFIFLYLAGYIIAGFSVLTVPIIFIAALVISVLSYVVELVITSPVTNYSHALVSFVVSFLVLVAARYMIPGSDITFFGSIIVSLLIAAVDLFLPEKEANKEK